MADWQDEQQNNRRFAHRSQGRKGGRHNGRNGDKDVFRPRNMLGRYALRHRSFAGGVPPKNSWLEIHELDESETGFIATFDLGAISGVMLIAGSRKALRALVDEHSSQQLSTVSTDVDVDDAEVISEEDRANGKEGDNSDTNSTAPSQESDGLESNDPATPTISSPLDFAHPPELDRPAHAFEKNTFRQPKWFAQWRGQVTEKAIHSAILNNHIKSMTEEEVQKERPWHTTHEDNKAHLEFATGGCREFNAIFSCPYLGFKNVSLHGWKETKDITPAELHWTSFNELTEEDEPDNAS